MKKSILEFLLLILVVGMLMGCDFKKDSKAYESESENEMDEIDLKLEKMSLEEKVGQMIIVSAKWQGTSLSESFRSVLDNVKPGGIIMFADNVSNYQQLITYMDEINETADISLFWSIDQEGGTIQRLTTDNVGAINIPSMYYLGQTNDTDLAFNVGKVMGEELRVFGFNMDFAPVADVWTNPENMVIGKRAFGDNTLVVSKMIIPFAKGLESTGVIAVYKHFPGHGDTQTDSHYSLPVITKTKEELLNNEIIPFKEAIDNGAQVIMVGHLAVPALTGDNVTPTSLSKETITDFLKGELGYSGLVITDALNMKALDVYSNKERCVKAVLAGVDLLLAPEDPEEAKEAIVDAVRDGEISEEAINNSVRKILELKQNIKTDRLSKSYLNSVEHKVVISKIPAGE